MPEAHNLKEPVSFGGGFAVVWSSSYLRMIAVFVVLLNVINSTGEFIFAKLVVQEAAVAVAHGSTKSVAIGEIDSTYFMWVNALGVLFQAFLVSRLFRYIGVRWSVMILPVIATIGYGFVAFFPVFTMIRAIKILENSTDYSISQTTRHALFLPVTQAAKYDGKTAIDTFFWRSHGNCQSTIEELNRRRNFRSAELIGTSLGPSPGPLYAEFHRTLDPCVRRSYPQSANHGRLVGLWSHEDLSPGPVVRPLGRDSYL